MLQPNPSVLNRIQLSKPVLTLSQLETIKQSKFDVKHLSTLYRGDLEEALQRLGKRRFKLHVKAIRF